MPADDAAEAGSGCARSVERRRSAASRAARSGRAPIVKMSRRMPPTPVAAPWNGSTALGWLCDSILRTHSQPVADVDRAGVLARPLQHARAAGREALQQRARVLVAAVLAPHRAEHAQLDQVRLAAQQLQDQRVLARARARRRAVGVVRRVRSSTHSHGRHPQQCRTPGIRRRADRRCCPAAGRGPLGVRHQRRRRCRAALVIPAIRPGEPFGLAAALTLPSASQ